MFDWIKRLLGLTDCKGCVYRRFWGLYCGKRGGMLPHSAWQKFGCWHFVNAALARTAHNEEGVN